MDFINDLSTETVFDLIKQYYRDEQGKEIQIGSDEFAMASMIAYVFGVLVQKFNAQAKQRYLATATGEYLDALGETFNVSRPVAVHASCYMSVGFSGGSSLTLTNGEFIVADANGVKFTPAQTVTIESPGADNILFVGYGNDDVLDENNIEIDAIKTVVTDISGMILHVTNTTITGGAVDEFPDTDEGDDRFREYIIAKRSSVSTGGPASAYEQRAKEADGRVLDAYCLRYTDSMFEAGKARVFIKTKLGDPGLEEEVLERVRIALNDESWKPVCDTVEVHMSGDIVIYPIFIVGLSAKNAIAGREKFENDMAEYCDYLTTHLGKAFSLSELCRRAQTPDENGVKTEYVMLVNPMYNYVEVGKSESFRRIDWRVSEYAIV